MGNILHNQKNIFEAITIVLSVTFVQLTPGVQMFSIGTAQLFFFSFVILSRNNSFTYGVLVSSTVNKSYCTCREIIEYYFDRRIPFLNSHMRNCSSKIAVLGMFSIFWKLSGIWEELGICVSRMENFVWSSRSATSRLMMSCPRSRT